MNNYIEPMVIDSPINCICGGKSTIELYDSFGKPLHYKSLLEIINNNINEDKITIHNKTFKYFKCKKCREEFDIDWANTEKIFQLPVPLFYKERNSNFIYNFIKGGN